MSLKSSFRTARNAVALLVASMLVTACETAAQREVVSARSVLQTAMAERMRCGQAVADKPEYAPIKRRYAIGRPATLEQMSDQSLPTPDDIRLFMAWHAENQDCRRTVTSSLQAPLPEVALALATNYAKFDEIHAAFVRREITWGVLNSRTNTEATNSDERFRQALAMVDARLGQAHQAEMARRQAAAAALSAAAANIQQQQMQQQMINAINRPTTTNCTRLGNTVNCTSF